MIKKKALCLSVLAFILLSNSALFSQYSFYIRDHLGNTRVVLDQNGNTKAIYDYHPFGLTLREIVTGETARYKFTGKELDDEGGLDWYYFGARYYDASIGRWLSVEPALLRWSPKRIIEHGLLGISPYGYVRNNPLNRFDPDGFEDKKAMVKAGVRIVGGGLGYVGSKALMVGSAFAQGPTFGLSTIGIFAGIAGQTFSAFEVARGIEEFKIAKATPEGMTAESFANLAEQIAREIGAGDLSSELTGMLADILLGGGKNISKNMINEKFIQVIISTGQLSEDVIEVLKASLNSTENDDKSRSEENQQKNEKEKLDDKDEEKNN